MSVKTLIVAAGLVAGATTAAFAQDGGWVGVAGPGAPAYGPGCYACPPGTGGAIYNQAIPRGALLDYAGLAPSIVYGPEPYASGDPFHTGSDYLWFRPDGPGRGNSAESER